MNKMGRLIIVVVIGLSVVTLSGYYAARQFTTLARSKAATDGGEAGVLKVEADFAGGAVEVISIDQTKREITVSPPHRPRRGFEAWWYFKVTGVRPGELLTVKLTGGTLRGNGNRTWAFVDAAMFSPDDETWTLTAPGERVMEDGIVYMVYRQKVAADACWFAYHMPYLPRHARELIHQAEQVNPYAKGFELCRTRADYPVPALRIVEPGAAEGERLGIWVHARTHAFESGSSWVCHGFAEWLMSDDPAAKRLRQKAEIVIVPIVDVDSVMHGTGGKMQYPRDHNRDWTDKPYWESVRAAMREIKEMSAANRFDLFIDIHGPGAPAPYFFTPWIEKLPDLQPNQPQKLFTSFPGQVVEGPPS